MFVCGLFLYLTNREYHAWFEEVGRAPVFESRDCQDWLNTSSVFLNYLRRRPDEQIRFLSERNDGSKPFVYRGGKAAVGIGLNGNFLSNEGNLYAQLGGKIRIKRIGDSRLFGAAKKIMDNHGLMAEATYESGYVKLTFYDRGRMSASCNMINANVKCVDSNLSPKTWKEVVKLSHEPAIALNILCKRTPRMAQLLKDLKQDAGLVCKGEFPLTNDARAICPHIPEI